MGHDRGWIRSAQDMMVEELRKDRRFQDVTPQGLGNITFKFTLRPLQVTYDYDVDSGRLYYLTRYSFWPLVTKEGKFELRGFDLNMKNTKVILDRKRRGSYAKLMHEGVVASGIQKAAQRATDRMQAKSKQSVVETALKNAKAALQKGRIQFEGSNYGSTFTYTYKTTAGDPVARLIVEFQPIYDSGITKGYKAQYHLEPVGKGEGVVKPQSAKTLKFFPRTAKGGGVTIYDTISKVRVDMSKVIAKDLKGIEKEELDRKKWYAAIDKRVKTAYGAQARPYKDNNPKRRGFVLFEYKGGGKPIYYVSVVFNKFAFSKGQMTSDVLVFLGTYKKNIEKYLKVDLDNETMADFFYENEETFKSRQTFTKLADITNYLTSIKSKVKAAIGQAKVEGKEATPETAAFLNRKFGKVQQKVMEREREKAMEWEMRNISEYDEARTKGLEWSAVMHDEGYANEVFEGFASAKDAKKYIIDRGGSANDWAVVYGTQLWNKRLGRTEED